MNDSNTGQPSPDGGMNSYPGWRGPFYQFPVFMSPQWPPTGPLPQLPPVWFWQTMSAGTPSAQIPPPGENPHALAQPPSDRRRSRSRSRSGSWSRSSSSSDHNNHRRRSRRRSWSRKDRSLNNWNTNWKLLESGLSHSIMVSEELLQQRAARFAPNSPTVHSQMDTDGDFSKPEATDCQVVGTCSDVEKPFLRLNSAPDPSQVRPVEILRESLTMAVDRWNVTYNYSYVCDQLKSIRKDLMVQGVRDAFTVLVYETHARIYLQNSDVEQFHQCQTQLRMLHAEVGGEHRNEFTAYRILNFLYTNNKQDLTTFISSISQEEMEDECIAHALSVARAWYTSNYNRFFVLYLNSPKMSGQLMGWFIDRERKSALKQMMISYRQTLPVVFVAERLAFESVAKFIEFATPFNLTYIGEESSLIDCKSSMLAILAAPTK